MNIAVVGPGALGCLFAARLTRGLTETDTELWLVDYNQQRVDYINRQGIIYEKDGRQQSYMVTATAEPAASGTMDVVLLCVKSYDVQASLAFCAPLLDADTLLIFLQNGISHLAPETLPEQATAVFGVTTEGSNRRDTGHIIHAGSGWTHLGTLTPLPPTPQLRLEQFITLLNDAGIAAAISDTILNNIWQKLLVNVGINGLTAVHNCANGELLNSSVTLETMEKLIDEAQQVARAQGLEISGDPFVTCRDVCRSTATNISSMLQDVRNGRRTEIDAINGAIVTLGQRLSVATPTNNALVEKIKELEQLMEKDVPLP